MKGDFLNISAYLAVMAALLHVLNPAFLWIACGLGAAVFIAWATTKYKKHALVREKQAAAAKREQEQAARIKEWKHRIDTLGRENAAYVESALEAVSQVRASEAARTGWLGDVDFDLDIRGITDNFKKAHVLRQVANKLSALDKPSDDDRGILEEANAAVANLERPAIERVDLIVKCATEARLIDKSLSDERKDAQTADQRAELHARLSAMLYGIEAAPSTPSTDSAIDAVMTRVQAYREIKNQIQLARDD